MSRVVLDTNILLRLANPAAAEHEVCRTAVTRVVEAGNTLATALTLGVTELVTLNTDDFKNMPDLVVRHPAAVAP